MSKSQLKISFLGAGSSIFIKNIIGDTFLFDALQESHIALYDIDSQRLKDSRLLIEALNRKLNAGRAVISIHCGVDQRKEALKDADFVFNAVQIGGYDPATIADFEIPKRHGLRQTIGDTLGVGGIFRALRTIPAVMDFLSDMEEVCPSAIFLNYTNPMAMVMGAAQRVSCIKSVGLCHSVQVCASRLLDSLGIEAGDIRWKIAGINHMAWLLDIRDGEVDLYPRIKTEAEEKNKTQVHDDMVRFEMMKYFGYYITESSEHLSEYLPYWIRKDSPELIERFHIPLDEYPRRCREQIREWAEQKETLMRGDGIQHEKSHEYGADIMNAVISDLPVRIHGNILNTPGYISNLVVDAVVEIPCLVDGNGIQGVHVGRIPPQCAVLNQTNINVQNMAVEAALCKRKECVYQAALLDPHTSVELPPEKIIALCDELLEAHEQWLPEYK